MNFDEFNEDSLKRLNGITMSAREAHMGDFLAKALKYFKSHDDSSPEKSEEGTSNIELELSEFNPIVVQKSEATTIKQLVSEYNNLLTKLEEAGFVVIE